MVTSGGVTVSEFRTFRAFMHTIVHSFVIYIRCVNRKYFVKQNDDRRPSYENTWDLCSIFFLLLGDNAVKRKTDKFNEINYF